jgi:hypothetical protein
MAMPPRRAWRQRHVVALSPGERVGVRGRNAPRSRDLRNRNGGKAAVSSAQVFNTPPQPSPTREEGDGARDFSRACGSFSGIGPGLAGTPSHGKEVGTTGAEPPRDIAFITSPTVRPRFTDRMPVRAVRRTMIRSCRWRGKCLGDRAIGAGFVRTNLGVGALFVRSQRSQGTGTGASCTRWFDCLTHRVGGDITHPITLSNAFQQPRSLRVRLWGAV